MIKETPILFSTEMVKAILDGRKTQTRRLDKLNKINQNASWYNHTDIKTDLGYPESEGKTWAFCPE